MLDSLPVIADDRRVDRLAPACPGGLDVHAVDLSLHDDLPSIETVWREFEATADATAFQTFDWLFAWWTHVGRLERVTPVIVIGRSPATGEMLFLLPLAIQPGLVRRLVFLGCDLCDYNAPLLAPGFSGRVDSACFAELWREILGRLQDEPRYHHDVVWLTKMPEAICGQPNPFLVLEVGLNASGAHISTLSDTWDEYYYAKRSSATRRRDRSKRKRLAEFGEVCLVRPQTREDIVRTVDHLLQQKARSFARMGVANVFARPGCRDFFVELALGARTRGLVHISRLDVGSIPAAVNYGLVFRGTFYHIVASYDDGPVARFGPGAAHLRDLLRHAIDLKCRRFDFTIGDEPYKREWSDCTLSLYDHVRASTLRGRPGAVMIRARRRVKRLVKQNSHLWSAFTRMRAALGAFRRSSADDGDNGAASSSSFRGARSDRAP